MEAIHADVVIVGAGGAGLRAAIAIAQSDPGLEVALISKVYPMRSHTCAAEGYLFLRSKVVELSRIELLTSCVQGRRSPS